MKRKPTTKDKLIGIGLFIGLCIIITNSIGAGERPGAVSKEQFGEDWPLTVDTAELDCLHDGARVVTIPGGGVFGLNGKAFNSGYSSADYYLKPHPQFSDIKASTAQLIEHAGTLCK